ncbi:MAG: outer membrane beta-barrel domain-containing protein [Bdellovibrio sp. CG10_big_fil_rev_8_21_14_0_10_47_8]|nr:MAG: outer membrane beta-barrel domain-containing protein [Bdellovibrio sp. CG10_big_fil_rev_8_21_14_0_10_47_8]
MTKYFLCLTLLLPLFASAAEVQNTEADFDSLGGNQTILERAKALAPEKNVSIVQNRTVSRRHRFELAPELSGTFGGDAYNRTKSLGLNLHYHFNPRWSVGLKYDYSFNTLTPEGEAQMDQAVEDYNKNPANPNKAFPQIDYPKSETLALVNWYPFYGKLNLLDKAVSHFDVYAIGGYGQIQLSSGSVPTYTAGGGIGFWINQHFSTRLEMRYQNYKTKYLDGDRTLDLALASVQMGWLL